SADGSLDRAQGRPERRPVLVVRPRHRQQRSISDGHGESRDDNRAIGADMYISKKHISRRTILRGMGVTVALPFLDAMVPAASAFANTEAGQSASKQRFVAMEMVHGNAGSTAIGV